MADSMNGGAAADLNLTPEEKRVFGTLFRQADTDSIGVITGENAVKFFERTRLEPRVLGEIWQIADKENRGLLTPAGFGVVLRLIGHAQAGRDPTPELAFQPGPLPKFSGPPVPGPADIQPPPGPPPSALQPQASGSGPIRVPPLTPDKVNQYALLFEKSGAQNGVLPGEQAKQIFERAGLPNEILGRIWNLADTEQRGALVVTEFIIAMHLLASFKTGALRGLPNILPAGLYEAAARRTPLRQMSGAGLGPGMGPPLMSAIPRQMSGTPRTSSPLSRSAYGPPAPAQQAQMMNPQSTGDWAISPADKEKFDSIYAGLDRANKGFITGDEAVPFFSESKLSEDVLAQIWDLADINSEGRLNRDEFAVAMHLIRLQRGKKDGRDSLPTTLPPNMIPPSMRHQIHPPQQPTAPTFDNTPQMPKSAADDLFGLDALSAPSPTAAKPQVPTSTGGSAAGFGADPFASNRQMTPTSPAQHSPVQSTNTFKPFVPSSSFGQSLSYNNTGGSGSAAPSQQNRFMQPQPPAIEEDLLGDADPEVSKKLTNETSELANLSNQVGTLSKQMQEVQHQRSTSQNELNQAQQQKREFEARLAQLRTLYENEAKDVRSLQERLTASRNETKKLEQEFAMVEGVYEDLKTQHGQALAALQADQQENANLKERMRAVNAEIAQLKPQLEKLRSEARHQKGLAAINKKQLSTSESERDKLETEAEELRKGNEEQARSMSAASEVRPSGVASPAPSNMSTTNPFFRRQGSTSEMSNSPFAQSPAPQQHNDRSFDNVFGPSFNASANASEATLSQRPDSRQREFSPARSVTFPTRSVDSGSERAPSSMSNRAPSESIPEANEPPAPPKSRQISSSFLPFPERTQSMTSSRQVSAPASRFGEDSSGIETPTNYSGATPTGSSDQAPQFPAVARHITGSSAASGPTTSIPGAFPGDANSNIVATPTGGSTNTDPSDPFAAVKPSGSSKDDFDSAFASFGGPSKSSTSKSGAFEPANASAFSREFPPISELEREDESDSASEGGNGFDDDFAPASAGHSRQASSASHNAEVQKHGNEGSGDTLSAPQTVSQESANESTVGAGPPSPSAQKSPPSYDQTVTSGQKVSDVDQFSGLLPSREEPAPSTVQQQQQQQAFGSSLPAGSSFAGPSTSTAQRPGTSSAQQVPAPPAKVSFASTNNNNSFDDDFDDLEDAAEGEAPDDDFGAGRNMSVTSGGGFGDEFNPVFDSPERKGTASSHSHKANDSAFSGFGDFGSSMHSAKGSQSGGGGSAKVNSNNDWDAIFAGLDGPAPPAKNPVGKGMDEASGANGAAPSSPTATSATAGQSGSGRKESAGNAEKPQLGRALTDAGEHDDPILKNLTGMGYKREEALKALEKYDYNLERAANYLASQS